MNNILNFDEYNVFEKNNPTNKKLWAKCKTWAKSRYEVCPSAYCNGAAAKRYKKLGGKWKKEKKTNEAYVGKSGELRDFSFNTPSDEVWTKDEFLFLAEKGLKEGHYLDDHTFDYLNDEYKELYMELCIKYKSIFEHSEGVVFRIIVFYPNESKEILFEKILNLVKKNVNNRLNITIPLQSDVIDCLPIDFQIEMINLMGSYNKRFFITKYQFSKLKKEAKDLIRTKNNIIIE